MIEIKEEFFTLPGYEDLYEVGCQGSIKSLRFDKEIMLRPGLSGGKKYSKGYRQVGLTKDGVRTSHYVHDLVALVFWGPKPDGLVVDHRDKVSTNNVFTNLEYGTQRHNLSKDKEGTSTHTGVSWYGQTNRWQANIYIDRKKKHLGYFKDEVEAAEAYQVALKNFKNK